MNERKPSEDVMRELCEAVDGWCGLEGVEAQPQWAPDAKRVWSAVNAYRAAKQPRTRAAIALEVMNKLAGKAGCSAYGFGPGKERQLTFNVPDGVGGKELLDLLTAFNNAEDPPPSSHPANALTDHDRDARPEEAEALPCPGCGRSMARVGGPGARRGWTCVHCNAAGDPEEDHPDACGCEEAEGLKAQIAALDKQLSALRARNFDLAMQAGRIRKLARSHEVQALFEAIDEEP